MTPCTADISRDCGEAGEASYLCPACTRVLANDLRELPSLVSELEVTLSRQRGTDYAGQTGGHGGETPLPIHAGAYADGWVLRNTLSTWARVLLEQGGRYSGSDDEASIAAWLNRNIEHIARSEWAPECADEIHYIVGTMRRTVDKPPDLVYLGPCNGQALVGTDGTISESPLDSDVCGGDVHAKPGERFGQCDECRATYDVSERNEWILALHRGRLVTANEATMLLKIGRSRVDTWVYRKRLVQRGTDQRNGRKIKLYLFDDLAQLIRDDTCESSALRETTAV